MLLRLTESATIRPAVVASPVLEIVPLDEPRGYGLVGELDLATAPQVSEVLRRECSQPGHVVLDLSKLRFMDSSGLHAIIQACERLDTNDKLILRNPSTPVQRVLDIAGVDSVPGLRVER